MRWVELARVIEKVSLQVHILTESGGRHDERVSGLERATQSAQLLVQSPPEQQGIAASALGDRVESTTSVGNNVVPEGLANKARFKQGNRRHRLVAVAIDERFKTFLEWSKAHDANATAIDPDTGEIVGARKLPQHLYASLPMITDVGMEAQSIVDNMPHDDGLEAWLGRLASPIPCQRTAISP